MLYFDARGVSRKQVVTFEGEMLRRWRYAPGFSQRYNFSLSKDRNTMIGKGELSVDDTTWEDDLNLTYTKIV